MKTISNIDIGCRSVELGVFFELMNSVVIFVIPLSMFFLGAPAKEKGNIMKMIRKYLAIGIHSNVSILDSKFYY